MTEKPEGNPHELQRLAAISAFRSPPLGPRSPSPTALLSLIGAAVFYLATAIYRDELDLAELPQRPPTPSHRAFR